MIKKKYKVKGMHCTACVFLIESDLEDVEVKARCSYNKQTLEVEFDPKKISEEKIKEIVQTSGYILA